jgi:hypothetical protein
MLITESPSPPSFELTAGRNTQSELNDGLAEEHGHGAGARAGQELHTTAAAVASVGPVRRRSNRPATTAVKVAEKQKTEVETAARRQRSALAQRGERASVQLAHELTWLESDNAAVLETARGMRAMDTQQCLIVEYALLDLHPSLNPSLGSAGFDRNSLQSLALTAFASSVCRGAASVPTHRRVPGE